VSQPLDLDTTSPSLITAVWRSVLPTGREIRVARRRLHGKALAIVGLLGASYWTLVISDLPLLVRMAAALVLVSALVAVGTSIMHDANHGSFSSHPWLNRALSYTSDALGASSWLWRIQHNAMHHGNTNVVGSDTDLELAPFARLAPSQPWHRWHRAQHIYMWPLYGFLAMKNLLVSDLLTIIQGKMDGQPLRQPVRPIVVIRITLGKLGHLGWAVVVPLLFNPWWTVLAFYVACSWLVGFVLAITFQLAHCVDVAEISPAGTARRGDDFAAHQLRTTVDVASPVPVVGHLFRWIVGGLDHQIEHHLSPRLPHTLYPKVAARFRAACKEHGITYRLHPGIVSAVRSHARWLHVMSKPTPTTT
jgi:linoleoyl-CoA desaturase